MLFPDDKNEELSVGPQTLNIGGARCRDGPESSRYSREDLGDVDRSTEDGKAISQRLRVCHGEDTESFVDIAVPDS